MKRYFTIFVFSLFVTLCFGYSISSNGKRFIQKYEKCVLHRYYDGNGYSIGWGHHFLKGENYKTISMWKANQLFSKDVAKTNASINRLLKPFEGKVRFRQGFIDGLGDLIYNCGEGGVKRSAFYNRLLNSRIKNGSFNKNDFNYTLTAVKNLRVTQRGHKPRRQECYEMMRK